MVEEMVRSWNGCAVDDGAAGVLVFKGIGYFVGLPTGRCDESAFLREEFRALTNERTVKG